VGRIIGIDLGTTNCCIAVMEGGEPRVINTRQGERTLPSVVAIKEDGRALVGELAKRQAVTNPTRTVHAVKRLIGRKIAEPDLDAWRTSVAYEMVAAANGDAWVRVGGHDYSPQEISALILEELKASAQEYFGEPIDGAVITVPAHFNDSQRQATRDAGAIAGLQVKKIINEPTAAALAYGVDKDRNELFAVFDLGGGTFDITILRASAGIFEILATNGDNCLGGNDFDQALVDYLLDDFRTATGVDLTRDAQALERVCQAAEEAKRELSSSATATIQLPYIANGPEGPLHLEKDPLERQMLEHCVAGLLDRLAGPCLVALEDAKVSPGDLDRVILVGGMTRMPAVQAKVQEIFGKAPSKDVNPDEAVALGAATQSAIMSGDLKSTVLLDVTPHSLGVKVRDDHMSVLIAKNTTIPAGVKRIYKTTHDSQEWVDIEVYQGESERVGENTHVGRFTLEGLPPAKAGDVLVEVVFLIDVDGIINATARELETGKQTSVRINPASGLTDAQFERICREHRQRID
jgi:molecular chaperone DnaK